MKREEVKKVVEVLQGDFPGLIKRGSSCRLLPLPSVLINPGFPVFKIEVGKVVFECILSYTSEDVVDCEWMLHKEVTTGIDVCSLYVLRRIFAL